MRRKEKNRGFILYVNKYMSSIYTHIHGWEKMYRNTAYISDTPHFQNSFKKWGTLRNWSKMSRHTLQLRKYVKAWDMYLSKYHTIIRVYGFEQEHFNLPIFLKPRMLALEYVRQILMVDNLLFSQHRKTITFPLP